jgi:hypothetical protein
MKKHLAIEVTNKYESEAVQKALLDMGFRWFEWSGNGNTVITKNEKTIFPIINNKGSKMIILQCGQAIDSCGGCNPHCNIDRIRVSFSDFFHTYAGHIERFPDYEPKQENKPMTNKIEKLNAKVNAFNHFSINNKAYPTEPPTNLDMIDAIDAAKDRMDKFEAESKVFEQQKYQSFKSANPIPEKADVNFFELDGMIMAIPPARMPEQILEYQLSKLEKGCWYLVRFNDGDLMNINFEEIDIFGNLKCSHILVLKSLKTGIDYAENTSIIKSHIKSIQKLDI